MDVENNKENREEQEQGARETGTSNAVDRAKDTLAAANGISAASLHVLPAHSWWLELNSESVIDNVNYYHLIASGGALNGTTYVVPGTTTVATFRHKATNVTKDDLVALDCILITFKREFEQLSKDSFKKRAVDTAVEAGMISKGDTFNDLLRKLTKYTKEEVAELRDKIDDLCTVERDFSREVFASWASQHNLNVQITDCCYGFKNGDKYLLQKPHRNWSGHAGYHYVQEAAGQVVKKLRHQTMSGAAARAVNKRVKGSRNRPPHTPVLIDITKGDPIVIKQERNPLKVSSQEKQVTEIAKIHSLSPEVVSSVVAVLHGKYGLFY